MDPQVLRATAFALIIFSLVALFAPVPQVLQHSRLATYFGYQPDGAVVCPLGYGPQLSAATLPGLRDATVFLNCTVWTGDPENPRADAMAVGADGHLLYLGPAHGLDTAGALRVEDLGGRFVIPGLVDAHVHLIGGGLSLSRLDLRGVRSKGEFVGRVCAAAGRLRPGQWLLGGSWDESRWGGGLPAASWVDGCTPHTPVFLMRMDSHSALANSAALRLAGVDGHTADPPGGIISRDAEGAPTGLLADNAMPLATAHIPPPTLDQRQEAFRAATRHALSKGITAVHDMGRVAFQEGEDAAWEDLEEIYAPAADAGQLPIRLYSFVPLTTWRRMAERVRHLGTTHPGGRLQWGGVKEFADGSLGSHTALMHEPYTDKPSSSGTRTIELEALRDLVTKADAAGLQVAIHAIGDRAVDEVVEIYASLPPLCARGGGGGSSSGSSSGGGGGDGEGGSGGGGGPERQQQRACSRRAGPRRHRVEHAQHLSGPGAARRMAAAGVAATPNPLHLLADAAVLEPRLGAGRAGPGRAYAFRTLLEAGVITAFASDWPVVPLEPLGTLRAAVHRGAPPGGGSGGSSHGGSSGSSHGGDGSSSSSGGGSSGSGGASPAAGPEALSYEEALRAHTAEGARAGLMEGAVGILRKGMAADFVVLSGPLDTEPAVERTYVDGLCMHGCSSTEPGSLSGHSEL